eukprot:200076_1
MAKMLSTRISKQTPKIKALRIGYHHNYHTKATCILSGTNQSTQPLNQLHTHQRRHSQYFVMDEHFEKKFMDEIKGQQDTVPKQYPQFVNSLQTHFPKSMLMSEYFYRAQQMTTDLGFTDENTMGMAALCRDEITGNCMDRIVQYWGKTFNCSSLAGFVTFGKTGLGAATAHAPFDEKDGKRRFVFVAMPHIAISKDGVIGKCLREGIDHESTACGALNAVVNELRNGKLVTQLDMNDIEQSLLRTKLLSGIRYGDTPTLEDVTRMASDMIAKDIDRLLSDNLDPTVFEYVVMTGVQINGPDDIDWIFPNKCWHTSDG